MLKKLAVVFALAVLVGITSCSTVVVSPNTFPVTVDYYGQSLAEMIAAGKYDRVNTDITEKHFPIPRIEFNSLAGIPRKVEIKPELVHFNKVMKSSDVLAELKKRGLRPANLQELLSFGAAYPEEQRKFPIVAFGAIRDGYQTVPYLWSNPDGRVLFLYYLGHDWSGHFRFLAVRES